MSKEINTPSGNVQSRRKDYYIVEDEMGEKFLLPYYAETFRVLMDDKETIRDMLNCLLGLDRDHEIIDLDYEFEKPIDVFMSEDDPIRLDVWVSTKDNRYFNVEMQNWSHSFFYDRIWLYNAYQTLRGKYEYNRSSYFKSLDENERRYRFYELPETISIWFCNFRILKSEKIFKDMWAVYSEDEVLRSNGKKPAQPLVAKNRYIIIDLPNFVQLRKSIGSREDFWLKLLSQGPLNVPESEDPVFAGARNRLRVSRMKPDLFKALEDKMFEEKHVREAIEAEAYLKGEARGAADERSRNEAANAARDSQRAEFLRSHNVPNELISEMLAIK
jgi:hypothetical protein